MTLGPTWASSSGRLGHAARSCMRRRAPAASRPRRLGPPGGLASTSPGSQLRCHGPAGIRPYGADAKGPASVPYVPAGTPLRPLAAARAGQQASSACACTSSYTFMHLSFTLSWTRRPVGDCGCPAGTGSASAAVFARLGTLPQGSAAAGRVVSAAMGVSLRVSLHDLGSVEFAQRWRTLRRLARRPVGRRRPACAASAWKSAAKCLLTA